MCRLRNIALESVTEKCDRRTNRQTDDRQSDPYVSLCFAGDTMIEHWYLVCMILVSSPFNWQHAVTLTFDLLQGQSCCQRGTTILRICLYKFELKLILKCYSHFFNITCLYWDWWSQNVGHFSLKGHYYFCLTWTLSGLGACLFCKHNLLTMTTDSGDWRGGRGAIWTPVLVQVPVVCRGQGIGQVLQNEWDKKVMW